MTCPLQTLHRFGSLMEVALPKKDSERWVMQLSVNRLLKAIVLLQGPLLKKQGL